MKDDIDDLTIDPRADEERAGLKAVVFGTQPRSVEGMVAQLIRKKIAARGVVEEKDLLAALSSVDPDMIFLEINGVSRSPIEEIVKAVFVWTKNYARKINAELNSPTSRLWDKARVIMYKTEPEDGAVNPAGETITDIDEVLFKCKEIGDIDYMGLYASWSFYSKLKPYIEKK